MRLLYTPIKDYVHTVEAVVNYAGLRDRVELVPTRPFDDARARLAINPIGKVPTLVLDDGRYLAGGPVIYEYLDSLHSRRRLYPSRGPRRFEVLRQAWLADALFDQFVLLVIEGWLEQPRPRPDFVARTWAKITAMLDRLERDAAEFGPLCIAQARCVGALAFLDLKLPKVGSQLPAVDPAYDWRHGRPALASWYHRASKRGLFNQPLMPA